jgi:hypothetical protein
MEPPLASRPVRGRGDHALRWLPAVAIAVAVVELIVHGRALLRALYMNPDVASAPALAQLIDSAPPDRVVTLGNYTWYEPLWFMQGTRWIPHHVQVWELAPVAATALMVALVLWALWRSFGPQAALVAAPALVVAGVGLRQVLFTLNTHGATMLHVAILGAALVLVARSERALRGPAVWALGVLVAALTAVGATDRLLLAAGIVPFALAPLLCWWRTRTPLHERVVRFAVPVAAIAVAGGEGLAAIMRHRHVVQAPGYQLAFVSFDHVVSNAQVLPAAWMNLAGGDFFGLAISFDAAVTFVIGALALAGAGLAARWARPLLRGRLAVGSPEQELLAVFWALVVFVTLLAFLLSSNPVDANSGRYLGAAFVGVIVLLAAFVAIAPSKRTAVVVGVNAFALLIAGRQLIDGVAPYGDGPTRVQADQIVRALRAHQVKYGYAGYDVAPVVTWQSRGAIEAYPVLETGCAPSMLCRFPLHTISSWYGRRGTTHTFLITRPPAGFTAVSAENDSSGRPYAYQQAGPYGLYFYDHDIGDQIR